MAYSEELDIRKTFPALDARQLTSYEPVKLRPSKLSMGGATFHVPNVPKNCSLEYDPSVAQHVVTPPPLTVADMMIGKTRVGMCTHFNIKNDYTPEEESEVCKENV
ncbi:hypothetical protein HID58_075175 [Brassica napus]|uniref:SKP1 component dimerisation domain-containing protein n=1 Tax=Brassica napus TaxID=3708 RepID=A0ABQ7YLK2_BRANA|nr:hypothetical protein HID58_075175 [Brassica napus]